MVSLFKKITFDEAIPKWLGGKLEIVPFVNPLQYAVKENVDAWMEGEPPVKLFFSEYQVITSGTVASIATVPIVPKEVSPENPAEASGSVSKRRSSVRVDAAEALTPTSLVTESGRRLSAAAS